MHKLFPFARLVTEKLPSKVREYSGIVYEKLGRRKLCLNVFKPRGPEGRYYPAVLMIYGGGWRSGDTSLVVPMAERLAAKGFVTVTPEYRLSVEALYPAAVIDLKTAVRWMRANASHYSIDTTRIASYGCSAGGELASFLGTTGDIKHFDVGEYLDHSSAVEAVVNVDGLLDFTDINSTRYDKNPDKPSAAHLWFGVSYRNDPGIWKAASPISYVSNSSPPMVFINSGQKHYHAGRDKFTSKLKEYDIYHEVHTLPGTHHTFWLFQPWFQETLGYTTKFLDKVFKLR